MSLREGIKDGWQKVSRDLRHQRDGRFYESPHPTTIPKAVLLALTPEVQLTVAFRAYSTLHEAGLWRTATVLYLISKRRYGCDIAPGARVGAGLRLTHCSDIVIGPNVELGDDVVIFNGTTLGNRLGSAKGGMPKVGSRVLIGTGAKCLGAIEIGDDARIGANAVVLNDVPSQAVAVGVPAKIKESSR